MASTATTSPTKLSVAFCICNGVTLSDFIPPSEILASLNMADMPIFPAEFKDAMKYRVSFDFLAPTMEAVASVPGLGPRISPTQTYQGALDAGTQYDILWVPAGPMSDPVTGEDLTPKSEVDFLAAQAPGAKYVMSVCAGSAILAKAGVLDGKRATTNKWLYRVIEKESPKVNWVADARWVIDGNIWTSSGVSAGSDMALAFLEHLVGREVAQYVRGIIEVIEHTQTEDPFAKFHKLV
ncbi:class I glutamine amidotransferase-like protein [Cylindrobasidium torrendii FP15055 ss-10]|uniref:Class I glutamine amidotransferase-like protein n=1 Tax=Cylindrobasidium torrendii FP15055 ss-10 TaxID=1314674 RepID=A0A0D7BCP9_9AGAR|nr:class I glutamine amidotransferase-like protein [Cylindrobasidium torrendii FP15055 ss-10]